MLVLELDSQSSLGKGSSSHPLLYNIGLVLGSILGNNQSIQSTQNTSIQIIFQYELEDILYSNQPKWRRKMVDLLAQSAHCLTVKRSKGSRASTVSEGIFTTNIWKTNFEKVKHHKR